GCCGIRPSSSSPARSRDSASAGASLWTKPVRRGRRITVLDMREQLPSSRRRTSFGLLLVGAVASGAVLLCAVIATGAVPTLIVPEGALAPALLLYLFAFTWWLVAACLIVGLLLRIRAGPGRPVAALGIVGVTCFVAAVGVLLQADLFLWPFTAEFR